jgi:hypothetical protein
MLARNRAIQYGINGFVCDSVDGMLSAVGRISRKLIAAVATASRRRSSAVVSSLRTTRGSIGILFNHAETENLDLRFR